MSIQHQEFCEICGDTQDSLSACGMCGSLACTECRSIEQNLCDVCAESKCSICGEFLSSRACNICGALVCEDHGMRENEATTCINCQAN